MNERIRELAGRALDQAVPETWSTLTGEQLDRFQEKFAELIVRECADIADGLLEDNTGSEVMFRIKEHFGVRS